MLLEPCATDAPWSLLVRPIFVGRLGTLAGFFRTYIPGLTKTGPLVGHATILAHHLDRFDVVVWYRSLRGLAAKNKSLAASDKPRLETSPT
jgi:hypothetical protein